MTSNGIVLFIHQSPEMYGSDRVMLNLAKELQAAGQFHPVVVLPSLGPLHDALIACNIEVHVGEVAKISRGMFGPIGLIRLFGRVIRAVRDLDRIVGGRNITLVHSNTLAVLSGAIWARLRKTKHVWHVHEILVSPKVVSRGFPRIVDWFSHRVISNSRLTERWLLSERPRLVSRSVVVFNGLPEQSKPTPHAIREFREGVGAGKGDLVVTLVGRINRMKGQSLFLSAATELRRRGCAGSMHFLIVGGPAPGLEYLPNQLAEQAKSAGLSGQCHFRPFVADIWPVWFATDIAVVPSTEPESFGLVAIEAMAAGIPVIAAGHGGVLDIIVDGETGILFPPQNALALADAIERLASNPGLRAEMGSAGANRQRALFSVETQVEKTTQVYKEMME